MMTPGILNSQEIESDFNLKILNFKMGFIKNNSPLSRNSTFVQQTPVDICSCYLFYS